MQAAKSEEQAHVESEEQAPVVSEKQSEIRDGIDKHISEYKSALEEYKKYLKIKQDMKHLTNYTTQEEMEQSNKELVQRKEQVTEAFLQAVEKQYEMDGQIVPAEANLDPKVKRKLKNGYTSFGKNLKADGKILNTEIPNFFFAKVDVLREQAEQADEAARAPPKTGWRIAAAKLLPFSTSNSTPTSAPTSGGNRKRHTRKHKKQNNKSKKNHKKHNKKRRVTRSKRRRAH
jgi:hypothetical protein